MKKISGQFLRSKYSNCYFNSAYNFTMLITYMRTSGVNLNTFGVLLVNIPGMSYIFMQLIPANSRINIAKQDYFQYKSGEPHKSLKTFRSVLL
jgi:hypothetical protein